MYDAFVLSSLFRSRSFFLLGSYKDFDDNGVNSTDPRVSPHQRSINPTICPARPRCFDQGRFESERAPTPELRPGPIRHGGDRGLRIIIPVTNVNIVCQREIRRPIKRIKKNRKVSRTVKNDEKKELHTYFFLIAYCRFERVSFARV